MQQRLFDESKLSRARGGIAFVEPIEARFDGVGEIFAIFAAWFAGFVTIAG